MEISQRNKWSCGVLGLLSQQCSTTFATFKLFFTSVVLGQVDESTSNKLKVMLSVRLPSALKVLRKCVSHVVR